MRIKPLFISLLLLLFTLCLNAKGPNPRAEKGILDLGKIDNPDHFVIKLNGEWEFYWKKILHNYEGMLPKYFLTHKNECHIVYSLKRVVIKYIS